MWVRLANALWQRIQPRNIFSRRHALGYSAAAMAAGSVPHTNAVGIASGLTAALLALAAPAWAQGQDEAQREAERTSMRSLMQADLETLMNTPIEVSTATKTVQTIHEAPAIITTITRDQIAVWGYRSVAEVLDHVLGFFVVDDHVSPNLAVRGISGGLYAESSIVKVLIDGHSVAFYSTGGNALGPELVPLTAVDRVEIIRGPASSLYGADAFLGVVNIKTRDGKSLEGATSWVSGGRVGSHLGGDVDVSAGLSRGMVDALVAFRRNLQDLSGLELPATSPAPSIPEYNLGATRARGLDQRSTSALGKLTLRPREGSDVGAFAYYSTSERGGEFGALFQLANGFNDRGAFSENRISRWQFRTGLTLDQRLGRRARLEFRGAYFEGGPRSDNRLEVGSEFFYVRREYGFRGTDLDGHVEWDPHASLRLVLGGSLLVDDEQLPSRLGIAKQRLQDVGAGQVIEAVSVHQGRKTFVNGGSYLQGSWTPLGPYLGLTGGIRYDNHNIYGEQVSHRLGLVSSPRPNLHLKLLHGNAFKAPPPLLLYAIPSTTGDVIGNPNLKPQYVNTFELLAAWSHRWLELSSDVAYSVVDDKTEFIQQGINKIARNVAHATTVSWESLVELKPSDWLQGYASFEWQRTRQRSGDEGFPAQVVGTAGTIYPNVMVHAGLAVQPRRLHLRAAVQSSYIGERRASENNILLGGHAYTLPGYFLLEAKLATRGFQLFRDPAQELSFAVSGRNLLGTTGPAPGFSGVDYPLPPRAIFLEMDLTL
jgi:iron complex outermembrane receptor protein